MVEWLGLLPAKWEDASSKPTGTKIYFESKQISSFRKIYLRKENEEEENDNDES